VTYHDLQLRSVQLTEERCLRGTRHIARAPDRVAHTLLDWIADNYKPTLDELSLEIAQLEDEVVQTPTKGTLNRLLQIKNEMLRRRWGLDPAASSASFVATLVDVMGLVIYFNVALLILRGTLL